jgi:uncharacterized protein (TIGR00369 family)
MNDVVVEAPRAWTDAEILERFANSKSAPAASRTLGFKVKSVSQAERRVDIEFDAKAELLANPMGQIQGGMVCAMLDEAMSVSVLVTSGMTCVAPTLEMKVSFLRPALPGRLLAVGSVLKWGKTVAFTEGSLFDAEGQLLAKATGTAVPTPFHRFKRSGPER